jgi:hypothetical protein
MTNRDTEPVPATPSQARVWNHWLGGSDTFPVDREAGDRFAAGFPGIIESVRTTRRFLARAVTHLTAVAGIRQFLDVGSGLPTAGNTHQIAQAQAPDSHVVYADNDPEVVRYANDRLLTSSPEGATAFVEADLRDPAEILTAAARTLRLERPVALVLGGILGHMPSHAEALGIVRRLLAGLPSGSYLLVHDVTDTDADWRAAQARYNTSGAVAYHLRSADQIAAYLGGLDLVEPGVVPLAHWRPDGDSAAADRTCIVGGIGRKP